MAIGLRLGAMLLVFAASGTATRADSPSIEVGAGITVDVAPFGIEYVEPELAAAIWFGSGWFRLGLFTEASAWADRADLSALVCARTETGPIDFFGGFGALASFESEFLLMPSVSGGLRFRIGRFVLLTPMLSVRFKPTGSDTEFRTVIAWAF